MSVSGLYLPAATETLSNFHGFYGAFLMIDATHVHALST
ncbi:Unknown protein sequence [Pseudomonas syringae pv. maculicola]|nr:Unknown protein sequence [Pseudomonas syringae pv. maculicola]